MPETADTETTPPNERLVEAAILQDSPEEEPIKKHTVMIGSRAIEVVTQAAANVKPEILHQAAAGSIAREIIAGIDPHGRNFDKQKFEELDEEAKAAVAVELVRSVGHVQFKEAFPSYFKRAEKDLVEKLIAAGLGEVVARYLPDFAGTQIEKENIALLLMKEKQGFRVAMYRQIFGKLSPEIEKRIEDYM
jgi:hypothetical protein